MSREIVICIICLLHLGRVLIVIELIWASWDSRNFHLVGSSVRVENMRFGFSIFVDQVAHSGSVLVNLRGRDKFQTDSSQQSGWSDDNACSPFLLWLDGYNTQDMVSKSTSVRPNLEDERTEEDEQEVWVVEEVLEYVKVFASNLSAVNEIEDLKEHEGVVNLSQLFPLE